MPGRADESRERGAARGRCKPRSPRERLLLSEPCGPEVATPRAISTYTQPLGENRGVASGQQRRAPPPFLVAGALWLRGWGGYRSWRNVATFPRPPPQRTAQALERMCILTPARQTSHRHFRCYCPKRDWAPPGGPAHLSKGRHHLPSHSTRNSSPRSPASPARPVPFLLFPSALPLPWLRATAPPQTWAPQQALKGLPSPNQSVVGKTKQQDSGVLWEVVATGMNQEGHVGTFWGDENVLYLNRGLGYTSV